ncbi:MAG: response regulator [Gammaproteobacteria bacterium]|nr:response regulator [Gammaproteobacteria bacterium]
MQPYQYSSKLILVSGFAFVILIMTALTITWTIHVFESKENIKVIFGEQKQSRLLVTMRDAARQRAIYLHRMAMMKDAFDRDEEYMKFNEAASEFVNARDELLSMENEASQEIQIWNKARPDIINGQTTQLETAELILQDRSVEANELLLRKVIPIQNQVNDTLSAMFGVQKDTAAQAYAAAIKRNEKIYWIAILSGSSAVLLTIVIATIVIRRTRYAESSLVEARIAAQTATEMKSQFLANMSHEIRTPLTAVIGYADTLLEKNISETDRQHRATRILNNGKHLLHIINDILDISKIEAGELSIEKLSVSQAQLMADIDTLIGGSIRDKGLDFQIDIQFPVPAKINTDPTRLKQILLNLLGNARKFTEKGSIVLKAAYNAGSRQMYYEVADTGVGMDEAERSRLFKPFTQADTSTTRKFGGTGLGLYISRQLAHMLGGDLVCQSEKGKGSRFVATIDTGIIADQCLISSFDSDSLIHGQRERETIPALQGNVLLAEDNPDNQRLISMYIRHTGASVVVVNNGKEAVEQAIGGNFHLVLMDMQMPLMGGAEAVQWLRQVGNQTPIAMLTANAMKEEKDRCTKLGANEFLTKPIDKQAFYLVLEKYLENGGQQKAGINAEYDAELAKLVDEFIDSLPQLAESLQSAAARQNWEQLRSLVHQLKGMGGGFGFKKITVLSERVEADLKANAIKDAINVLGELLKYIDRAVEEHESSTNARKLGT